MTRRLDQPYESSSNGERDPALLRIWRLVSEGRMAEAKRRLDALLDRSPESFLAWLMRASVQFHLGNYADGADSAQHAIDLDPSSRQAWVSKGLCLAEMGMNEAAIECYRSAIQLQDDDADAWQEIGKSYGRLNRHKEAIRAFKKALEVDDGADETWYSLALSLLKLGKLDDALACFDTALRIDPRAADTWSARGECCLAIAEKNLRSRNGDKNAMGVFYAREALRNQDNALRIDPQHDVARRNRHYLLIERFDGRLETVPTFEGKLPGFPILPEP
jgi:tetratricopeptide (TPR) repeat protein